MSEKMNLAARIQGMQPAEIVKDEDVRAKYIELFNQLWREGGEAAYEREKVYFVQKINDLTKAEAQSAAKNNRQPKRLEPFSVFNCFLESAITNLSIKPEAQALAYLNTRNMQAGGEWVLQMEFVVSAYGELVSRIRCGQIRHADTPVIVYEGDEFIVRDVDGKKSLTYGRNMAHNSSKIVACYVRITRTDGTNDYAVMYEEDWKRLEGYSAKNNKKYDQQTRQYVNGNPNALYVSDNGQIDAGFLAAKCIRHAFKTYPKVRIGGSYARTEAEVEQEQLADVAQYGGADEDMFGGSDESVQYANEIGAGEAAPAYEGNTNANTDDLF